MFKDEKHDPAAVREFREGRGWTHEQMADEVCASPLEVAAWEAGTVRLPAEQADIIRALASHDLRRAAVVAAGLPRCAWADANAPGLHEMLCMQPLLVDYDLAAQRHLGECPICRRVHAFGRRLRVSAPEMRLGSEPVDLRRGLLEVAGLLVVLAVAGWFGTGAIERWAESSLFLALVLVLGPGLVAFGWTADMLRDFARHKPYVAGLAAAATGVPITLFGLLATYPGAGDWSWVMGVVLTLLVGVLMGRWNERRAREEEEDGDGTPAGGSALAPSGAPLLRDPAPGPDFVRAEPADFTHVPRRST